MTDGQTPQEHTSDDTANLLRTQQGYRRAHDARPHCRLKSFFSGTPANTRRSFIFLETKVPELHEGCYSIGLSVFTFMQVFETKKMCSKRALTRDPVL